MTKGVRITKDGRGHIHIRLDAGLRATLARGVRKDARHKDSGAGYKLELEGFTGTFTSLSALKAHVASLKRQYPNLVGKTARVWEGKMSPKNEYITYSGSPTLIRVGDEVEAPCDCKH